MTERAKLAQDFHDQGYNCAQAVACAYCDLVGLDKETAYKIIGKASASAWAAWRCAAR